MSGPRVINRGICCGQQWCVDCDSREQAEQVLRDHEAAEKVRRARRGALDQLVEDLAAAESNGG